MTNIKVETLSINDFNHICRLCSSGGELKPLFENIETLSMLESFTQMQFSKTDELPDKICPNCSTKITETFNFVNNCKIVDEHFRKCLNDNINQLDINTDELHSSIEIKDEPEAAETPETPIIDLIDEEPENANIKKIDLKQSEYYLQQRGSSTHIQEDKHFQVSATKSPANNLDLVEEQALRRVQLASKIRHKTQVYKRTLDQMNDLANAMFDRRGHANSARAKLTLPHDDHNYILRHQLETPERIVIRRALAREQMRKYRSKLTAEETAQHRKYRTEVLDSLAPKMQIPLRLSEMAQTLLRPRDCARTVPQEVSRFSLRPTKIPQVKKHCYETNVCASDNQRVLTFRSWKRVNETPEDVTVRLAKNTLHMKRFLPMQKEQAPPLVPLEESALRRAKAAGQLRQYRPVLRKNKTIPVPSSGK